MWGSAGWYYLTDRSLTLMERQLHANQCIDEHNSKAEPVLDSCTHCHIDLSHMVLGLTPCPCCVKSHSQLPLLNPIGSGLSSNSLMSSLSPYYRFVSGTILVTNSLSQSFPQVLLGVTFTLYFVFVSVSVFVRPQ